MIKTEIKWQEVGTASLITHRPAEHKNSQTCCPQCMFGKPLELLWFGVQKSQQKILNSSEMIKTFGQKILLPNLVQNWCPWFSRHLSSCPSFHLFINFCSLKNNQITSIAYQEIKFKTILKKYIAQSYQFMKLIRRTCEWHLPDVKSNVTIHPHQNLFQNSAYERKENKW